MVENALFAFLVHLFWQLMQLQPYGENVVMCLQLMVRDVMHISYP
jgi:hypothetical protein